MYRFEKAYYTVIARSHVNIASRERIEFITTETWCHIVSLRESVLCNHITPRFCKAETRSRRTNSAENIWPFRILIDLILWQILVRSKKLDFAFFASMHARRIRCITLLIDFSIIFNFSHRIDISIEISTVKSLDIESLMSQAVSESFETQWCYMMWFAFSFIIAELRQLIFVSWCIFHSILDIEFHIDALSHEEIQNVAIFQMLDRTFYNSILRHVEINRISIRSFLQSSHRCMILSRWKSLLESFRQRIVEKITSLRKSRRWKSFKTRIVERVCTKTSNQTELVRILSRRHRRMLWKSVEKYSFRKKIIKKSIDIIWRKKN